ncbi:MAG: hypothetical protein DRI89_02915 [Bacteroidetes bacterium]|nr:MAG: hypothetical protein DRI89_02915 [Bacteroidota bacterium]
MKKLIIILVALFAMQTTSVFAQTTDIVDFQAILQDVTLIDVTAGDAIVVTFATADEYNNGFDVITPVTTVEVTALLNWDMTIQAPDLEIVAGGVFIPINNIGVWCESTGTFTFGTELTCAYTTITTPKGLTNAAEDLITNGSDNAGDPSETSFNLNWEMGSMEGGMNGTSMFDQLSNDDFTVGTYNTVITLTLVTL